MRHLRRPVCIVLLGLAIAVSAPGRVVGAAAQAAEEARLVFGPLADDLSQSLGVAVALRISPDYAS